MTQKKIIKKHKEIVEFKDIVPDMVGEDYGQQKVIIVAKGTLKEMEKYMTGSQLGMDEYLEFHDVEQDEYVAIKLVDDYSSFDHQLGSTIVYRYEDDGVIVYNK